MIRRPMLQRSMSQSLWLVCLGLVLVGGAMWPTAPVSAQGPSGSIKIGLLYDHTGPFAAAGALNCWRGAKMIIDYVNEHGGVAGKYKVVRVDGDSQSKGDVALNEAERLLNVEKVDVLAGIYSSAHAVPLAERVDKDKKVLWITTAISSKVIDGRNLQYTFRPQPTGDQFGKLSVQYIADYAQEKFGKGAKDLRLAIIYEDGPYGTDVAVGNEARAKELGLNLVLKEAYSAQAPDLSSLVAKLRAARPDVLFHTGYNPDILLFLRQAKEGGLRVRAYIGHGAGHSQLDKMKEAFGNDIEGFHTVDPAASQLLDPKGLKPGVWDMTEEMVRRYRKEFGEGPLAPHVSMGFNNLWILFNDVLPRAIQKYGGWSPDAIAKAARETDIPAGGTMMGYGVKFYPPGHRFGGQNERSFPVVFQVIKGEFEIVFPKTVAKGKPTVLLPRSSPWAFQ
jgi:branched-chain amino acid transport system substrate-binding protein